MKILFLLQSLYFLIFFKMDKYGVSYSMYMSIPFHSRITRQNRSKNERATPKGLKITLLGLDAKGNKNPKRTPRYFLLYLSRKKRNIQMDHQKYGLGGRGTSTSRVYTLMCPHLYIQCTQSIEKYIHIISDKSLYLIWMKFCVVRRTYVYQNTDISFYNIT